MTYSEILNRIEREKENLISSSVLPKWFMESDAVKKDSQTYLVRMYLDLISDNIESIRDELDDYDFSPVFSLYCDYYNGEREFDLDSFPDEVRLDT